MGLFDLFRTGKKPVRDLTPRLSYSVGIHETCRTLAQRFYGNDARWEEIYAANERVLKSVAQLGNDPLPPGTEIVVLAPRFGVDGLPFAETAAA
jgi:hypothetical protein